MATDLLLGAYAMAPTEPAAEEAQLRPPRVGEQHAVDLGFFLRDSVGNPLRGVVLCAWARPSWKVRAGALLRSPEVPHARIHRVRDDVICLASRVLVQHPLVVCLQNK
jgi:hypothetical protein